MAARYSEPLKMPEPFIQPQKTLPVKAILQKNPLPGNLPHLFYPDTPETDLSRASFT